MAAAEDAGAPPALKPRSGSDGAGCPLTPPGKTTPSIVETTSGYGDGPAFWNERYRQGAGVREWIGRWQDVAEVICRALAGRSRDQLQVLHAGCGNSELAEDMYASGFQQITSIDNSDVVIEQMRQKSEARQSNGLRWLCMDATMMEFSDGSFDVVIDKCLMDALACAADTEVQKASYLKEVIRVLRPGGLFILISLHPSRAARLQAEPWHFQLEETVRMGTCATDVLRRTKASADVLACWPEFVSALSRGLTRHDFELADAEGSWVSAEGLEAGDVVEVESAFLSGDEPGDQVSLEVGLRGIVRVVDCDGDAVIRFPRLPETQRVDRFVMQVQLKHLRKRVPLTADKLRH